MVRRRRHILDLTEPIDAPCAENAAAAAAAPAIWLSGGQLTTKADKAVLHLGDLPPADDNAALILCSDISGDWGDSIGHFGIHVTLTIGRAIGRDVSGRLMRHSSQGIVLGLPTYDQRNILWMRFGLAVPESAKTSTISDNLEIVEDIRILAMFTGLHDAPQPGTASDLLRQDNMIANTLGSLRWSVGGAEGSQAQARE